VSREPLVGSRFPPSAVLFDLGGTLTFHLQAWTECLAERYGFVLSAGDAQTWNAPRKLDDLK
jgi:beta-phosphoglucomutase-like phosphatase (HAD superfamily)